MDLFKGKSASERNKLIAAVVLGVLAIAALAFAFGPGLFSSGASASVTVTSSPKPQERPNTDPNRFQMPSSTAQEFDYATTPILYNPSSYGAPDPGRNIFAFYEPPPPCPTCPTPLPPTPKPPTPTPTPPIMVHQISPPSVYAGSRGFRLDVMGERMTGEARIYFNQSEVPTRFVNEQRLTADIPANFIANAGSAQVIVQTRDGRSYSNAVMLQVMPPPQPQVAYVGMISRAHGNNDTAYFIDQNSLNRPGVVPTGARLNDVVGGRFRLVSIAANRVVLEDVQLGFKHQLELQKPPPGTPTTGTGMPPAGGFPGMPVNRAFPNGFPQPAMPRPSTNTNRARPVNPNEKRDEDDGDDDGDGN